MNVVIPFIALFFVACYLKRNQGLFLVLHMFYQEFPTW